jgi:tRNA threonylcarbamoyl adenosine modification protein YeaZ
VLVLALDTSGAAVTVALHDGGGVVARRSTLDARRHAELLAPSIAAVLDEGGATRTDVTALAVGVGPGPFTGLRAGIVTARVLGLALGVDVVGVCSLDALALQVAREVRGEGVDARSGGRFVVSTDARRHELYWGLYEHAPDGDVVPRRLEGPVVTTPADLPRDVLVAGRGATLYPDLFAPPPGPLDVDAGAVAGLAVRSLKGSSDSSGNRHLLPPEPLYLRRPDASPPGARKRVLT